VVRREFSIRRPRPNLHELGWLRASTSGKAKLRSSGLSLPETATASSLRRQQRHSTSRSTAAVSRVCTVPCRRQAPLEHVGPNPGRTLPLEGPTPGNQPNLCTDLCTRRGGTGRICGDVEVPPRRGVTVHRGQPGSQRLCETRETRVVVLITQRSRVQIPPPLPRPEALSRTEKGPSACGLCTTVRPAMSCRDG
jgi:hypothetical protein